MANSSSVRANKKLGQHFLTDPAIIDAIVSAISPQPHQNLLEIGPGLGAITLPVLEQAKTLTAIELDHRVIPILQNKAAPVGELNIIEQDVLTIDYSTLMGNKPWYVFGNLPYNISTPILFTLTGVAEISHMVFMLQKEVVDRMAASPSDSDYGRLSVMLQYHHDVEFLFEVPPESFSPPPKVMSAMVSLNRLERPRWQVHNPKHFALVVKQAFAMRRKTLRNNLKSLISSYAIESLGIDPSLRAEAISGESFALISNFICQSND